VSWECGICRAIEGRDEVRLVAVCHHCGIPLCEHDRYTIEDPVFGGDAASHCIDCLEREHAGFGRRIAVSGSAR